MGKFGKFLRDESGASAALYALALPALVGMVGLGFDYSRLVSLDTELQNAADQAALAGATQLDQLPGSIARATGEMPTEFPINHADPIAFEPKTFVPSVPQSPTNGLNFTY